MLSTLVMTVIGPDRSGLVELVASRVASHGGNWLESRMCRLGGQFAGIVRVEVAAERAAALVEALGTLESEGLRIMLHTEGAAAENTAGNIIALELVGQDRPGILHQISRILAAHHVNVEELTSERVSAPMDGSMLFLARAKVKLPGTTSLSALREDIELIASDLMVDVQLQPAGKS